MNNQYKYYAFISYSHLDKKWGNWLLNSIEKFKVPKNLIGQELNGDIIPKKIFPIFRDEDELPTNSNLGNTIEEALKSSKYLIVVCSPNSAKSIWVDKEIRLFKKLHGGGRVLPIIVDGEPNASDKPQLNKEEAFPESLKYEIDIDGNITKNRVEPIAADARNEGSGKNKAKIKLISGMLGIGFDELWKREEKRRKKNIIIYSVVGSIIFITILALAIFSSIKWKEAERQKTTIETQMEVLNETIDKEKNLAGLAFYEKARLSYLDKKFNTAYFYNLLALNKINIGKYDSLADRKQFKKPILIGNMLFNPYFPILKSIELNGTLNRAISFFDNKTLITNSIDGNISFIQFDKVNQEANISKYTYTKLNKHEYISNNYLSNDGSLLAMQKIKEFKSKDKLMNKTSINYTIFDLKNKNDILEISDKNIRDLDFSWDNKNIALAFVDENISIIDLKIKKEVKNIVTKDDVFSVKFFKNNLLIYSLKEKIVFYDLKQNKEIATFKNKIEGYWIEDMDVTNDGLLVAKSIGNEIYIYDLNSKKLIKYINYYNSQQFSISAIKLSPDGEELVLGSDNGDIYFIDVKTGEKKYDLRIRPPFPSRIFYSEKINSLAFSPNGELLSAFTYINNKNYIYTWYLSKINRGKIYNKKGVSDIKVSPNNEIIGTLSSHGDLAFFNFKSGKFLYSFSGVSKFEFSNNNNYLAIGGYSGDVYIYDINASKNGGYKSISSYEIAEYSNHKGLITDFSFSKNADKLLSTSKTSEDSISNIIYDKDIGFYTTKKEDVLIAFDLNKKEVIYSIDNNHSMLIDHGLKGIDFSLDDSKIITHTDNSIFLLNGDNFNSIYSYSPAERGIKDITFIEDNSSIITFSEIMPIVGNKVAHLKIQNDTSVSKYIIRNGEDIIRSGSVQINDIAFLTQKNLIAIVTNDKHIVISDIKENRIILNYKYENGDLTPISIEFSSDGEVVIVGYDNGEVQSLRLDKLFKLSDKEFLEKEIERIKANSYIDVEGLDIVPK